MKHDLLKHDQLQCIIGILRNAPFPIRLVGGAVRDAFLGRDIVDFDFAAACAFGELKSFLEQSPCTIARTNTQHGSILFTHQGHGYDITILRQDMRTDGRHAEIVRTDSWRIDAERRDFTVNALSMDLDGHCFDPLGQGVQDLDNRHLRFIGQTRDRIQEDYLRILRFFRFQGALEFAIDPNDLTILTEESPSLRKLSRQRIREEMRKILFLPKLDAVQEMTRCGISKHIFPQCSPKNIGFLQNFRHPDADWICRLAAWFRNIPEAKQEIPHALAFSKAETARFQQYLNPPTLPINPALWLYRYGRALSLDYFWLYADQEEMLEALRSEVIPVFPVTSRDLMALGYAGSKLGAALSQAETLWIASDMQRDRRDLLADF